MNSSCGICSNDATARCECQDIKLCDTHIKTHTKSPGRHNIIQLYGGKKRNKSVSFSKNSNSAEEEKKSPKPARRDEERKSSLRTILENESRRLANFKASANECLQVQAEDLIYSVIQQTKQLSAQVIQQCMEKEYMIQQALNELEQMGGDQIPVGNPVIERIKEAGSVNMELVTVEGNVEPVELEYENIIDINVQLVQVTSIVDIGHYFEHNSAEMNTKIKKMYNKVLKEEHYEITKIDASDCNLGKKIDQLVRILPHYQKVEILKLAGNNLGEEGATELAGALENLRKIHTLDLGNNDLRGGGLEALSSSLGCLKEMKKLNLSRNNLSATGARHLSMIIGQLHRIKELGLDSNHLGTEGARNLQSAFQRLTNVKILKLRDNNFSSESTKHLISALGRLNKLEVLKLERNGLSQEDKKSIQNVVRPGCKVSFG